MAPPVNPSKSKTGSGIPAAVIKRLPVYQRFLTDLKEKEITRISSNELAVRVGITASQLRQDLSWFGSFGQQGYGYRVDDLLREVNRILGLDRSHRMILAGAGSLGRAILNYANFKRRGFTVTAIFDKNPRIIGENINGITVRDITEMAYFLRASPVEIGVITTPAAAAQDIANRMVAEGVKGIWNFAPFSLVVPPEVVMEHVHLGESLLVLSLKLNQKKKKIRRR
ncbi:MAG TPA: redox-sensing transcriptional repressor Rex [Bacillota bacterium]|nr:redox-sensing transcriptional repressor Rex [Bacillota bacterium]